MSDQEQFTAWVTKHALTSGIMKVTAEHFPDSAMISYRPMGVTFDMYAHGKDWHRSFDAALLRAEEMRKAKIKSLIRSIEKLQKLTFIPEQSA